MLKGVGGVDLGDDERDVLVEAEGVRVVHDHGAALHRLGVEREGHIVLCRTEHDVNAVEGLGGRRLDRDLAPRGRHDLAGRAQARQQFEGTDRKLLFLQTLEHLRAHCPGCADDGDGIRLHVAPPSQKDVSNTAPRAARWTTLMSPAPCRRALAPLERPALPWTPGAHGWNGDEN